MATAAISQPTQATYGSYGVVTILERTRTLVRVQTSNELEFWVKAEKLKPVRVPKVAKAQATAPVVIEEPVDNAWKNFVTYLNASGFRLVVQTTTASAEQAMDEYHTWAGEELPEKAIYFYEKHRTREWRLFFKISDNVNVPFPLELKGTTGVTVRSTKPRGLYDDKGQAHVNFASIIETLVRAGLRA
jgi:hypothetical protein